MPWWVGRSDGMWIYANNARTGQEICLLDSNDSLIYGRASLARGSPGDSVTNDSRVPIWALGRDERLKELIWPSSQALGREKRIAERASRCESAPHFYWQDRQRAPSSVAKEGSVLLSTTQKNGGWQAWKLDTILDKTERQFQLGPLTQHIIFPILCRTCSRPDSTMPAQPLPWSSVVAWPDTLLPGQFWSTADVHMDQRGGHHDPDF